MSVSRSFASDNNAGVHPKVMRALAAANAGPDAVGYGDDPLTKRVEAALMRLFGARAVGLVLSGTAANVLSAASAVRAHQAVVCAEDAHMNAEEAGATERFVGCKLVGCRTIDGKLSARELESRLAGLNAHRVEPRLVSVTQCTEVGTVYSLEELRELSRVCRRRGLLLHMDGARLANAAASLGVSPRRLTREAGVDILSFGLTKDGAMMADAVVFFDAGLARGFRIVRNQGLQLASKLRFVSAQFEALLHEDLWLANARRANAMARRLAARVGRVAGVSLAYPVETNAVFARLPRALLRAFAKRRFFYVWDERECVARFMCSFATTASEVDEFAADLESAHKKLRGRR